MLEGAGCHLAHASQQLFVHVGQLNECDVRCVAERLLDDVEQGVRAEQHESAQYQVVVVAEVDRHDVIGANQFEGQTGDHCRQRDDDGRPEQL